MENAKMRLTWERFNASELLKFVVVGGLNAFVGFGSFAFLIALDIHYVFAATLSHIVGVVHSYFWNKYFTFKTARGITRVEVGKFIAIYVVVYAINILLLRLFIEQLHIHPLLVQAFSIAIITAISFIGQKYWVFGKKVTQNKSFQVL